MKLTRLMSAGMLALSPIATMAAGLGNTVDAYYISSGVQLSAEGSALDDNGDGYGIKGTFAVADQWFLSGEYQKAEADFSMADVDMELEQVRLGGGFNRAINERAQFYALAEYIRADSKLAVSGVSESNAENGFGLHVGLLVDVTDAFGINGRIGYVDVDANGIEYVVGASYRFTQQLGLFADYRVSNLSDYRAPGVTEDLDLDLDDLRVGVRFKF